MSPFLSSSSALSSCRLGLTGGLLALAALLASPNPSAKAEPASADSSHVTSRGGHGGHGGFGHYGSYGHDYRAYGHGYYPYGHGYPYDSRYYDHGRRMPDSDRDQGESGRRF